MNTLIVVVALLGACVATELGGVDVQQDTAGNYKLKYHFDDASRSEEGFQGNKVNGVYTFKDTDGHHHTVKYFADENGYVAHGDLPTPVQDTLAVAEVRAAHLAEDAKLRSILPTLVEDPIVQFVQHEPVLFHQQTVPVEFRVVPLTTHHLVDNTAEIEEAKAQHFAAHREALERLAEAYRNL